MMKTISESTEYIKSHMENYSPKLAIILGSGLGIFADSADDKIEISYQEIPNFHEPTVVGHEGRIVIGKISGVEVLIMQGRYHFYEGHSIDEVVFPVRVMAKLGIENLIITNAAGGLNPSYEPGDLAIITDHINLTGQNPLIGKNLDELGPRFPDMTEAYNLELNQILHDCASETGFEAKTGIYAGFSGPSYETPAEINMVKVIGGDLVGMSTVSEVIAANHAGIKVCGISCVTNLAAGISAEKLSHAEVKEVANLSMEKFTNLLTASINRMGQLS